MSGLKPFGSLVTSVGNTQAEPKKKAASRKVADQPLEVLYEKVVAAGKVSPAVRSAIIAKDNFSEIKPNYCKLICGLCTDSRRPSRVRLQHHEYDIAIIQDFQAPDDRWKTGDQIERNYRGIINYLASKYFQGLTFTVLDSLKCRPGLADIKSQKVPISKMKGCAPYLLEELRQIKPKAIIALGTNSLKLIGLNLSDTTNRGEIHHSEFGQVVITLHPKQTTMIRQNASGKMWGADYLEVIDRDFHKAARIARGELVVPTLEEAIELAKKRIWVTKNLEEVTDACKRLMALPSNQVISYDLETTSLDAWSPMAKILTAQFGYRDTDGEYSAIVIPLWHRENHWYKANEAWPHIVPILLGDNPKVGHNIKFDIIYTYVTQGVRLVNARFDTMLLLHAINSGLQKNYGLKRAVWDWIPESGLGGYEDKLPALTKGLKDESDEEGEDEEESES